MILHNFYDMKFPWLILESDAEPKKPGRKMVTRGGPLKLHKEFRATPAKRGVFSSVVVIDWNKLPPGVANAATLNAFKNGLDRSWGSRKFDYTVYGC